MVEKKRAHVKTKYFIEVGLSVFKWLLILYSFWAWLKIFFSELE
jgi:hypothetical protein